MHCEERNLKCLIPTYTEHNSLFKVWVIMRQTRDLLLFLPIFLDFKAPFPFQMLVFVIISKQWLNRVTSSSHHSRGSIFSWSCVWLNLNFRWVAPNHVSHFIHWKNIELNYHLFTNTNYILKVNTQWTLNRVDLVVQGACVSWEW